MLLKLNQNKISDQQGSQICLFYIFSVLVLSAPNDTFTKIGKKFETEAI